MTMKKPYPLISSKNIPAYLTVMSIWILISLISATALRYASGGVIGWATALIWGFISVMAGMAIMFGASAVNLRKLRPGFGRLASGEKDPEIPPVWCPVLTMATRAAVDLREKLESREVKS